MGRAGRDPLRGMLIRALGLALLVGSALLFMRLFGRSPVPAAHATIGDATMAAIGFISFSAGCILTSQGAHIHDRVEVAARWRSASSSQGRR